MIKTLLSWLVLEAQHTVLLFHRHLAAKSTSKDLSKKKIVFLFFKIFAINILLSAALHIIVSRKLQQQQLFACIVLFKVNLWFLPLHSRLVLHPANREIETCASRLINLLRDSKKIIFRTKRTTGNLELITRALSLSCSKIEIYIAANYRLSLERF